MSRNPGFLPGFWCAGVFIPENIGTPCSNTQKKIKSLKENDNTFHPEKSTLLRKNVEEFFLKPIQFLFSSSENPWRRFARQNRPGVPVPSPQRRKVVLSGKKVALIRIYIQDETDECNRNQ
jgi:hypothetical protein